MTESKKPTVDLVLKRDRAFCQLDRLLAPGDIERYVQAAVRAYTLQCRRAAQVIRTMPAPYAERDVEKWAMGLAQKEPFVNALLGAMGDSND